MGLIAIALLPLATGCAGSSRPRPESAARLKDSAPEKIAAQRAAGRGLGLEGDDERWGVEAARERRRAAQDQRDQRDQRDQKDQQLQKATATQPTQGPPYILQTPVR